MIAVDRMKCVNRAGLDGANIKADSVEIELNSVGRTRKENVIVEQGSAYNASANYTSVNFLALIAFRYFLFRERAAMSALVKLW